MCTSSLDCPNTGSPCVLRVCAGGFCDTKLVDQGTAVGLPDGDCKGLVCDGEGDADEVVDDTDLPPNTSGCVANGCDSGNPTVTKLTGNTCDETGGKVCLDGACVACSTPRDCVQGVCTPEGQCAEAACDDTVKNGDESDTDCGGSCPPCPDLATCIVPGDCASLVCAGGFCEAPTCFDTTANGDETDVDCGGLSCSPCAVGQKCLGPTDCASGACAAGLCQ